MNWRKQNLAFVITLLYVLGGFVWILVFDFVFKPTAAHSNIPGSAHLYKAWILILLSGVPFYALINAYIRRQQRHQHVYQSLVEYSTQGFIIIQKNRIVFSNQTAANLVGYTLDELYLLNTKQVLALVQPEDRKVWVNAIREVATHHGEPKIQEIRFITKDYKTLWLSCSLTTLPYQGKPAIQVICSDITENKIVEGSLKRKDSILEAVGYAAEQLLKAAEWTESIESVLECLGQATKSSRTYIFKKLVTSRGVTLVSQIYEWTAPGIPSQDDNINMQGLDYSAAGYQRWLDLLAQFRPIYGIVSSLPEEERHFLIEQNVKSILVIPIRVEDHWWGFIGFDDCLTERVWPASEIEALESAASILGAVIERKKSELSIERQMRELVVLHNVSIAQVQAVNLDELLFRVTDIIGEAFYTDNFGVMLLDDDGKHLRQHTSYYGVPSTIAPEIYPITTGITGKVTRTGMPFRTGDVRRVKEYVQVIPETMSELCVPIKIGERVLGVINAESRDLDAFSEDDERLLNTIAGGLANSIEKIRLFENEQLRRREAETQSRAAAAVSSSLDLNTVLDTILESLSQVIPYDSASISLVETDDLRIVAQKGFSESDVFLVNQVARKSKIFNAIKKSGKATLIEDIQEDKRFLQWSNGAKIRGWIGIPLIARGEVIGLMALDSHHPGAFTESQKLFAQTLAYQAAGAIQNARSFDSEQRRRQEAEILRRASEKVSSSLELKDVLGNLLDALKQAIPYDSASVFLAEGDVVRIMACHMAQEQQDVIGKTFPINNPLLQEVKAQGRPVILDDSQTDPRFWKWGSTDYVHGWMGIPLVVRGETIGFITLDSRKKAAFDQENANLAQAFAYQAAVAIQNATLYMEAIQAAERRSILHRLSQDINLSTSDPEQTYQTIYSAVRELMACDAFLIALRDELLDEHNIGYIFEGERRYESVRLKAGQGITGKVIQSGQSLLINDYSLVDDKKTIRLGSNKKVHSILAVPLRLGNQVIGVLSTQSYHRNAYGDEERVLLEMLANHATIALENSRLFQETQKRLADLESLVQASKALNQTLELEPLLQDIIKAACGTIPAAEKGSLCLFENTNQLRIHATSGYEEHIRGKCFKLHSDYEWQKIKEYLPALIPDVHTNNTLVYDGECAEIDEIKSKIVSPLMSKEQIIGVISLDNATRKHAFTEDDLKLLVTLAAQAALAIENARLFSEIRQRLNELVAVNLISGTLRTAQTLDDMLPALLDETLDILDLQVGAVWLIDNNIGKLYQAEARGWLRQLPFTQIEPGEGIIGYTFETGELYYAEDLNTDVHAHPENRVRSPSGWTGIFIPIRSAGESIGVFLVAVRHPRQLEEDEIRLLTTFADMAGSAIHRMSLYQRVEQQVQRLTALRDVDTAITSSFDLRVTLNILIDNAVSHLGVDAAAVLLFNPNSQTLTYAAGRGFHTLGVTRSMVRVGDGLAGRAVLDRKLVSEPDLPSSTTFRRDQLFTNENFISYYGVPLIAKGQVKGILEIFHRSPLTPTQDWLEFFQTLAGQAAIAIDNAQMFDKLQRSNQELVMAYDTTLEGWSKALELRDRETEGHSQRVTDLTVQLARRMGVPPASLVHIRRGVLLHDIGKMGIPDHILRKTGQLNDTEWESMRMHPQLAYDLLSPISYLRPALDIPYCHHEMWNGKGYPRGLKDEEIPIAARIFAVVDVWDALASNRPYRSAWPRKRIIRYIRSEAGKRFDPMVVDVFLEMIVDDEEK